MEKNYKSFKFLKRQLILFLTVIFFSNSYAQCIIPDFSMSVGAGGALTVTNTSTLVGGEGWQWSFSDGSNTLPTQVNMVETHTFAAQGTYTVWFLYWSTNTVTPCPASSISKTVNINTGPCNATPLFMSYSKDTLNPILTWNVFVNYTGNNVSALWNWGDGNTSVGLFPAPHTYSASGIYNICLTTSVSCGTSTTVCMSANIFKYNASNVSPIQVIVKPYGHPLSINLQIEQKMEKLLIYPNPSNNGQFVIKGYRNEEIEVFDNLGRLMPIGNVKQTEMQILDLSHLDNGIYYIKNKGGCTNKIIISK